MIADFEWTAERVADLRRLWGEGLSSGEIARRLGCSKNGVVGKVHRLNLPKRESPIGRRGPRVDRPATVVALPTTKRVLAIVHKAQAQHLNAVREARGGVKTPYAMQPGFGGGGPVPLPAFLRACQWIEGDPREGATICGAKSEPGRPYCAAHAARAYTARVAAADEDGSAA